MTTAVELVVMENETLITSSDDASEDFVLEITEFYQGPKGDTGPMPEFDGTNFLLHYTLSKG